MATNIRSDAKSFSHDNFSATVTASSRTLPAQTSSVLVHNLDSSISILVSLDGGTNFKTVVAGASLSLDMDNLKTLHIKSASSTASVECLYGYQG